MINNFNIANGTTVFNYYYNMCQKIPDEKNLIKIFQITQDISEIEKIFNYNKLNINTISI